MSEQQKQSNKYPFDDEIMTYDYITHRYVLTERGVFNELGVNLDAILNASGDANPSALATRILKRASETVYLWLYKDSWNAQWLEYVLATLPSLRATVKEMLQSQLLYMLANGDLGLYSGVNIAKGQAMNIADLRGRARIAPEVEDLAMQTVPELGYCLKYTGMLPCVPYEIYRRGY